MTHRAYLMFSLDPAWRDGIKTFLDFSLREHKPDIYQPILKSGGNNVIISGTTARTQMTHRAYLMFSLDPAWRDGIKTFLNFSLREHKPDIYQPILKSGGNNIIINGTTDGGTFNSGPSEKKEIAWSVG
ncbi:unnamed protein product [Rhizophagus irregularis]|nr:unnamed protein product [Rhizophagus irregularis]